MTKKAPFFSHDMNARHDPKISAMRGVYGAEGYGWFWILIEMMAESDGYQLDCKSKYTFNAYAMQLQCTSEKVQEFVSDCISEFELFESDGEYFWSNSLRKRMQYRDAVSEKRKAAADKRWEKQQADANASEKDANAMQNDANKTKQNKTLKPIGDSNECADAFEQFWKVYPNKKGKEVARKSWVKLWKENKIVMDDVLRGTANYVAHVKNKQLLKPDFEYCYGSTFVNQQRWNDEWAIVQSNVVNLPQTDPDELKRQHVKAVMEAQNKTYEPREIPWSS
jgi:hypothetical protein